MKKIILTLAIALATGGGTALAASNGHEHGHDISSHQMPVAAHQATGVVKAINEKAGKVQIAHEPVASLAWPAMTMWFALRDPLPKGIKVGDAVQFEMMQSEKKQWEIVGIARK